jgi:hypothetical protein
LLLSLFIGSPNRLQQVGLNIMCKDAIKAVSETFNDKLARLSTANLSTNAVSYGKQNAITPQLGYANIRQLSSGDKDTILVFEATLAYISSSPNINFKGSHN